MTTLAYITDECRSDAEKHGITNELEKLRIRVEHEQSTRLFDHFPSDFIVKKKFGHYNNRVIGKHVSITIDNETEVDVVVFLRVLIRGVREYQQFSSNPDSFGESYLTPLIDIEALKLWSQDRLKSSPATPLPEITDGEYGFLYDALHVKEGSSYISESHEWFEIVTQDVFRAYMFTIGTHVGMIASQKKDGVRVDRIGQLYISTRYFALADIFVLMNISLSEKPDCDLVNIPSDSSAEEIDKFCRRKYPDYILADLDLWMNIEKDKAGNLALSPEESSVLKSVRQETNQNPFPLFINGRAGSGKSTIIQYIYCDIMRYWLANKPTVHPPIYLTYNKSLMDSARVSVESILKHDVGNFDVVSSDKIEAHRADLDMSLREFHEFLYSHLEQDDYPRFPRNARMTFGRFKEEWATSQANNPSSAKLGPDLCWHILRTFIKGFEPDTDSYLDPEDYQNIHAGDKNNITNEVYRTVYSAIFENWYKPICSHEEATEYWDDQDLVRYLISNDRLKPNHPAIVCDEAQDFTRIELDAILRLNLFSNRSLGRQIVSKIPLVFAGDQFQTLNPTGFRWESVKAWFVENFIHKLDPNSKRSEINYRELCYNYRSTGEIVRFSNLIQYRRGVQFEMLGELSPQNPWSKKRDTPVMRFSPNDAKLWEKLTTTMNNAVIIIPCDEEDVQSYIRSDKYLWDFVPREGDTPLMPIMCPSHAKGLEFQDVVLYRFGKKHCESKFDYKIRRLEAEYFVNRLYVGVTRPKKRLIILDDLDMEFWNFAKNPEAIAVEISKKNQSTSNRWADSLACLVEGNVELFQTSASFQEYEDTAKQLYDSAYPNRDAYIMRQAAAQFGFASKESKRRQCLAWAASFDGKLLDSAEEFEKAGMWKEAASQLFAVATMEAWEKLYKLSASHPEIMNDSYTRLIDSHLNSGSQWEEAIREFESRLNAGQIDVGDHNSCNAWKKLLLSFYDNNCTNEQLALLLNAYSRAQINRIPIPDETLGNISYSLGNWKAAIDYWDRAKHTKHNEYKDAKKQLGIDGFSQEKHTESSTSENSDSEQSPQYTVFEDLVNKGHASKAIQLITLSHLTHPDSQSGWKAIFAKYDCEALYSELRILHSIDKGSFEIDKWPVDGILHVISALSSSEKLLGLPEASQRKIATLLMNYWESEKEHLLPTKAKPDADRDHIDDIFYLGCAIERSGNRNDAVNFYREIKRNEFLAGGFKGYIESRLFRSEMRRAKAKRDPRLISDILRRFPGKTEMGIEEYASKFSTKTRIATIIRELKAEVQSKIAEEPHQDSSRNPSLDGDDSSSSSKTTHEEQSTVGTKPVSDEALSTSEPPITKPDSHTDGIKENFKFQIASLVFEGWARTQRIQITDIGGRMVRIQLPKRIISSDDFDFSPSEPTIEISEWGISFNNSRANEIQISLLQYGFRFVL